MKQPQEGQMQGTSQQRSSESPIISQDGLRVLVDLAHVLLELDRHDCVRLCMWLSHTAEIHAHTIIHLSHYQINSPQPPSRTNIVLDPGVSHGLRGR